MLKLCGLIGVEPPKCDHKPTFEEITKVLSESKILDETYFTFPEKTLFYYYRFIQPETPKLSKTQLSNMIIEKLKEEKRCCVM